MNHEIAEAFRRHDSGQCKPQDHDRALPDGQFEVHDKDLTSLYYGDSYTEALRVQKAAWAALGDKFNGYVTKGEQMVADDGQLGCNECAAPLYYCQNTGWYHHVDPDRMCNLAGAEKHDYYSARQVVS
jgi:hypothetical protein